MTSEKWKKLQKYSDYSFAIAVLLFLTEISAIFQIINAFDVKGYAGGVILADLS